MERVEIAIIGAGITGLSAAWQLAKAGREVIVFERFELGHDKGSSHGATRIFRFAYADPTYVGLAQAALPLWRELEAESGTELLRVTGGLDLGPGDRLDATEAALRSSGANAERLGPAQIRERFSALDPGDANGLFSPDTGILAAARTLDALARCARERAAEIREEAPVRSLGPRSDDVVIGTDAGEIVAGRCIVAAGSWAGPLLASIGVTISLKVTREQVFYFKGPDDVPPLIHYGDVTRYAVPAFDGSAGIKIGEHMTGEVTSADGRSFEMDPENAARVASYVEGTLPGLDPEPVAFETCLYTTTADQGFVIDLVGPVIVASPCSGHGFKMGPIVGEMLAAIATGRDTTVPLDPFALGRPLLRASGLRLF